VLEGCQNPKTSQNDQVKACVQAEKRSSWKDQQIQGPLGGGRRELTITRRSHQLLLKGVTFRLALAVAVKKTLKMQEVDVERVSVCKPGRRSVHVTTG
jgi:hypothetical protein